MENARAAVSTLEEAQFRGMVASRAKNPKETRAMMLELRENNRLFRIRVIKDSFNINLKENLEK